MKIKAFLILVISFFLYNSIYAQTWQKTFQISATPKHLQEDSNGNLNVHFFNQNDSSWFKLRVNQLGDSLGIEYYNPPKRNYHTIEFQANQQMLTHWDTLDNVIWEVPISVPSNTNVISAFNGLVFLDYFLQNGNANSSSTIWVYDKNGNLVFNEIADGPLNLSTWVVKPKLDGTTLLTKVSGSGWLPQGAQEAYYYHYLFDTTGSVVCLDEGLFSNYKNSVELDDLAINGEGNCDAIGIQELGLSTISPGPFIVDEPGQFTPCTDFIIPFGMTFPSNVEMIGLQTDAFATIGYGFQELTLTRIDCDTPIHNALCLYSTTTNVNAYICEGEEYIVGTDTFSSTITFAYITLEDSYGCDSIIDLDLTVIPSDPEVNPEFEAGDGNGFINLNAGCNSCTFEWSNGSIEENISNLDYGSYSVTITVFESCEYYYEFDLEMSTSSFDIKENKEELVLFPNVSLPNQMIRLNGFVDVGTTFCIYDINGKLEKSISDFGVSSEITFIAPSDKGVYFIKVLQEDRLMKNFKLLVF